MKEVKDIAKKLFENGKWYLYHLEHKKVARKMLKNIESDKGKLSTKNKKLCREYAREVLGSEKYAPWLYVYCAYAKKFKEGWIPDNYYGQHVLPKINGEYGEICARKAVVNSQLEISNSLDICYYINFLFLNTNYDVLEEDMLRKMLFAKSNKVVYKLETSQQGKGIYFFDEESFDVNVIKKLGNGVFQEYIEQHPFFSNFTKNSVATIRITSVCDDYGNIGIRARWLKFARGNDTHCMGDATMKIPFDIESGKLYGNAFFGTYKSTKLLPDNDFSFANKTLPSYGKCIDEVKRIHKKIRFARCLGWDLIVDKNGNVLLIEVNGGHSGIRFTETVQGPCFKGLQWENLHKSNKYRRNLT